MSTLKICVGIFSFLTYHRQGKVAYDGRTVNTDTRMTQTPDDRTQIWLAILASAAILTGIQLILPALPVMQRELGLSDSQISLVTSVYLFPSVLFAFPSGLLADRFGRRPVFIVSLSIFGLCGLALLFSPSFTIIVMIRVVQGSAFAAVHPLSITMIGDVRSGGDQVRAQGLRYVALAISDAALPVIGGLVVGISWLLPFSLQVVALPLALAGWVLMPKSSVSRQPAAGYWRPLFRILKHKTSLALQLSGFLRFVFKFALMTYLPILLVSNRGLSPTFVGVALGGAALSATAMVAVSARLVRLVAPSRLMALSLVVIGTSFIAISMDKSASFVLPLCFAFGAADGLYGVLQNALITQTPPADLRAAFIAATASVRNFGKFSAPSILGLSVLVFSLEQSFIFLGLLALAALLTIPILRQLDWRLTTDGSVDPIETTEPH